MTSPSGDYPRKVGSGNKGTVAKRNPDGPVNDYHAPRKVYQLKPADYSTTDAAPSNPDRTTGTKPLRIYVSGKASAPYKNTGGMLGNQRTIVVAWFIALAVIFFDEWHNNGVLARPQRLWWATGVYGMLAAMAFADALIPLANALAIGYAIVLIWQYYNGTGQFTSSGSGSGSGGGGGHKK